MKLVIGIDPGSRVTGFGIVGVSQNKYHYIDSGCIKTGASSDIPVASRLKIIYSSAWEP